MSAERETKVMARHWFLTRHQNQYLYVPNLIGEDHQVDRALWRGSILSFLWLCLGPGFCYQQCGGKTEALLKNCFEGELGGSTCNRVCSLQGMPGS